MRNRNLLASLLFVAAAACALMLGPLRAQESQPEPAASEAPEAPGPAGTEGGAGQSRSPPPAEAEAADVPPAEDSGLSADNSLSFPVDI